MLIAKNVVNFEQRQQRRPGPDLRDISLTLNTTCLGKKILKEMNRLNCKTTDTIRLNPTERLAMLGVGVSHHSRSRVNP